MALASTGALYLGGSTGGSSRCIRYEILGGYGTYTLDTANSASGNSSWTMNNYHSYSHAVPVTPTKCTVNSDILGVYAIFFCNVANDACQIRTRVNSGGFGSWQDATSPFYFEQLCFTSWTYYAEIRGRIGTNYSSACTPSGHSPSSCNQ